MSTATSLTSATNLLGRIALSALFLIEGWGKVAAYVPAQGYMEKFGVPGALLPAVIVLEIGGALLIILGYKARVTATALALFCIAAAVLFHQDLADRNQALHFWKDIGLAGGFLLLAAHGPAGWSLDGLIRSKSSQKA
ncbi:MAG: DoxX family protein [Hyphomicrobium sp.]|jgi:putative oxidoreductase